MEVEQPGHVAGVDPAHPALGADAPLAGAVGRGREGGVDVLDLAGGRARGLVGGVVGDEGEVELGVRADLQLAQRLEVGAVVAVLGDGERDEVQPAPGARGVCRGLRRTRRPTRRCSRRVGQDA